ncbi:GAF and ANTAR domain-containing protein [Actinokineospora sp. NBRC 105648]|uniref:GAF and ANTAR domain-containing protein n=1 Tax=Actinokineospora sp. NBRC 105648 TaxID=3032206 RepID=UPI0024A3B81E|nr:GAF and ANTAR domain-containing protein [Actinokineospora sp. NBRC 105648]GLZ36863.1 transcriptional regulator [Actinokineospora sp. NBRC 105648]
MATRAPLAEALIELSDTLAPGFDLVTHLRALAAHCVGLTGADAAGVLLADTDGTLRTLAAGPDEPGLAELFDAQAEDGPGVEAFATAALAHGPLERRSAFGAAAARAGFQLVHGIPMRLRGVSIGALCLYRTSDQPFTVDELDSVRALADVAAVGISTERAVREGRQRAEQLQSALDSRVVIEQAKGVLAERKGIEPTESFQELRRLARNHNLKIGQVAEEVVRSALPARLTARG